MGWAAPGFVPDNCHRKGGDMMEKVLFYSTGEAVVQVNFPSGEAVCKWCWPFLRVDNELHRCRCKLTGESIRDPQHEIGQQCPLIFRDKEE